MLESIIFFHFLLIANLFADFYKFFKFRLFNIIPENLQKTWENNETLQKQIIEKYYLFSQPVSKQPNSLL